MDNVAIKGLIENKDLDGLRKALLTNPYLANQSVPLSDDGTRKAHPLHRICDAVFSGKIRDEEAIEIAKIFLECGANINGDKLEGKRDSPLLAAASLHAEKLGIFYIENGAAIDYTGNDGETALHWAAYCGRDKLTEKLILAKADINLRDRSYNATPVDWAVQPMLSDDKSNIFRQADCIKLLLQYGADKTLLSTKTIQYLPQLAETDPELKKLV